jgi:3-deoxy-7-phosphoheptulonate synthase
MHGNGITTGSGLKTRSFDDILAEIERTFAVHEEVGTILGGVHFELTGEDVTECIGGGLTESDLDKRYLSVCDPRLNYRQALEMALRLGSWMSRSRRAQH